MSDPDLEQRVRQVEERLARLEHVVPAIDRDVNALQAQRRADLEVLMALRGTQLEQGERISTVQSELDQLRQETRTGFAEMRAGFSALTVILERLATPEGREE